MKTPVTPEGLAQYDELPAEEAVVRAWGLAGDYVNHHFRMQEEVKKQMPVLGRALDRLMWDHIERNQIINDNK